MIEIDHNFFDEQIRNSGKNVNQFPDLILNWIISLKGTKC